MKDLIKIYLDTTPEMLDKLKLAADGYYLQDIKNTAHKLRSSFGTMGVVIADDLLSKMENSAEQMGKEGVLAAFEKLDSIAKEVEKELTFELQEL